MPATPSAGSDAQRSPAFDVIDAIRACAALAVVWNHVWNLEEGAMRAGVSTWVHLIYVSAGFGQDAVFIFFVISGFWITKSVVGRLEHGRWNWIDYMLDRVTRLWLVLIPALVVGGAVDAAGRFVLHLPLYSALSVDAAPIDIATRLDVRHLLTTLFFLQDVMSPPFGSNGPLWSLAYEFWYYCWFPIIALTLRRHHPHWLLLLLVATAILLWPYFRAFPAWLAGSVVFQLSRDPSDLAQSSDARRPVVLALGAAVFLAAIGWEHLGNLSFLNGGLLVATGFACLLLAIVRTDARLPNAAMPLARYGGRASFSLYAAHYPVLLMIVALAGRQVGRPILGLIAALPIVVLLAVWGRVFAALTEARTGEVRRWLDRRSPRPAKLAGART